MKRFLLGRVVLLVSLIVFFIINLGVVDAALLGVNRASLTFNDVLRGGYAEQQVTVSIGVPNDVLVSFEARGDIADWIRFEPVEGSFFVNENRNGIINVIVEPPSDARVESYEGMVFISTGALGEINSSMGTNVVVAFEVKVLVDITDTQVLSCNAGGMVLSDFEVGENSNIRGSIRNTGNVRIRPSFDIKVFSQMQEEIVKELNYIHEEEVIPTKSLLIESFVNMDLEPGQYWAELSEPLCGSKSLITFSVLERGGISDEGDLKRVSAKTWASTNEIIPIIASFENKGVRTVSAQFKGTITKDDRIVEIIESDIINVAPGESIDLETFFTPKELGQYKVSGRVHFNNKVSFERGTVMNVNEEAAVAEISNGLDLWSLLFSLIIVVLAFLGFLILKKKKRKKRF